MSKHGERRKYTEKVARFQGYDIKKYTLEERGHYKKKYTLKEIEELFSDDRECIVSQLCVDIRALEALNTQMLQALEACGEAWVCPVCGKDKSIFKDNPAHDCILLAAIKKVREG